MPLSHAVTNVRRIILLSFADLAATDVDRLEEAIMAPAKLAILTFGDPYGSQNPGPESLWNYHADEGAQQT